MRDIADLIEASVTTDDGKPDWRLKLRTLPQNTGSGYECRLRLFDAYMTEQFPEVDPLDADDKHLTMFLCAEYRRKVSGSTMKSAVVAVNWRAKVMDRSKVSARHTRDALKALRREAVRRGRGQAASLSEDQILHLIETTAKAGNAWSLRDSALFSVCYYGLLRISEALDLDRDDVKFLPSGEATLKIVRSKTDQAGRGESVLIPEIGVPHLRRWIEFAGIESGPLFRSIQYSGFGETRVAGARGRLSYYQSNRTLMRRARRAGLGKVTTHSLRRSHCRVLMEKGATDLELQKAGRWQVAGSMPALYSSHADSQAGVIRKYYPSRLRSVKSA